jgi:hypothetical protein
MRWTGVKMKRLIAVALLTCIAACGQAQTITKKPKHAPTVQPEIEAIKPAVSDAFAKTALHFLIAIRQSDGSIIASNHIDTIHEDLVIEQSTPTEESLKQLFALKGINHQYYLEHPSGVFADQLHHDTECFNIYIDLLKVNDKKTDWNKKYSECADYKQVTK